ncbi:alpha-glucoside transport system permease protein [Arcanobacterium wilhelmae]|uniref:Alpha-glucoside transport system permease protein n=1 Tax=Arcanobacterium wilhelmae TaxID=1803177 RepID=A0ABT9NAQ0_9ACTO|nr:ABC transporter permease subunit [Arcanobacterium wilhelmae]MDP9800794.1 alpha-glucoside transport system permease protein [Arcanobacterium wilhelmae]WFN90171.1 ABC transporter permease subunit [Arcanobacterium wilhelmae]
MTAHTQGETHSPASAAGATLAPQRRNARSGDSSIPANIARFLLPAALLLVVLVIYPAVYSVFRSLFDDSGNFVGLANYATMFSASATQRAIQNNLIWVLAAPLITTVLGLIFAVLMDKIRWKTAFRLIIFMPMAISMLAAGIIFRSIFQQNPEIGTANATIVAVQSIFGDSSHYPGARPRDPEAISVADDGAMTTSTVRAGEPVLIPLVGVKPADQPKDAPPAAQPATDAGAITGTVWLDFARGGGGESGVIDANEIGLGGMEVSLVSADGQVAASTATADDGTFTITPPASGEYRITLPATNFAKGPTGFNWLGTSLITPVMIIAFVWIWAGFAMVMIGAGLSATDRSLQEAARVDGANEWQVFRHVTVPQLMPTVTVVLVTLTINVLKIFDLVYVIPPGQSKEAGTVVAVEMWKHFGNYSYGLGSALAVLLLLMVLPFMLWQVRNFRKGN